MEELLGLGGGSVGLGAIIWYAKTQFIKFDKRISTMKQDITEATKDNHIQEEQIKVLKEELKYLKGRFDRL
jgi:hypothetical protein